MGVVNSKSTLVSNFDAQPRVLSNGYQAGGNDTIGIATVAAAATDSIGSTYRFGFIPSGVRIQDIQLVTDATTAGVWQLGVYCNTQQGGVFTTGGVPATAQAGAVPVANANLIFGTGISTAAAQTTMKSVYTPTILTAAYTAANNILRVWELLGLSVDPFYEFHLVLTSTTAPTAAGNITLQWSWVR
jgi:hypothetical protein